MILQLISKEFRRYFYSWSGVFVLVLFLIVMGFMVWIAPDYTVLDQGVASLEVLFSLAPIFLMFLIPALSMGAFSEEYQSGTLQLLFSKPFSSWSIVLSKFLAVLILIIIAVLPTVLYAVSLGKLSVPQWSIDWGEIAGGYIGLIFLSTAFAAISIYASTLVRRQIEGFVLALFFCFILYYGFFLLSEMPVLAGSWDFWCQYLGGDFHYRSMSKGVISVQDIIYYISIVIFFLFLADKQLKAKSQSLK